MSSKIIAALFLVLSSLFVAATPVLADEGATCTNQYGSSVECPPNNIVVNKKVRSATNANVFVENITSRDPAYMPGEEVEYDVAVTNTSNANFATVTVIDVFPEEVEFVSGPGRYEKEFRKLTYEISDLKAGATVHNRMVVKILRNVAVPDCDVVNTVTATGPGGQSDQDTANLCVNVRVTEKLPEAGFEDYMFVYPFAALAAVGFGILMVPKRRLAS